MFFFGESAQNNAALDTCKVHIYKDARFFAREIDRRFHLDHFAQLFRAATPNNALFYETASKQAPMLLSKIVDFGGAEFRKTQAKIGFDYSISVARNPSCNIAKTIANGD